MSKNIRCYSLDSGDLFFDLQDFASYLDTSKVSFYEIETLDDKLLLRFYDKDMNLIQPFTHIPNL